MKKILNLTTLFVLAIFSIANAQLEIGVKTGLYFSNVQVSGIPTSIIPNTNVLIGTSSGISANIPITDKIAFQPEVLFTQKGFSISEGYELDILGLPINLGATITNRINYLEAPLLLKYTLDIDRFKFYGIAGPSVAYASNARTEATANVLFDIDIGSTSLNLENNNFNRWNIDANIGLGMSIETNSGAFFTDMRYQHGFSDIIEDTLIDIKIKNRGLGITAGYRITI